MQRAPGFPCALLFLSRVPIDAKLGRIAPRECGRTSSRCMTIESEIHTGVVPRKRPVRRSSQSEGGRRKRDPSIAMKRSAIRDHYRRRRAPGLRCAPSGLQPLLHGFGGSLGQNAALPDASPPPELWVASSSQSCRIPYSSSGVLFSSGAARSTNSAISHNPVGAIRCAIAPYGPASPRAQAKSSDPSRDKTTRRAKHPKPCPALFRKIFRLTRRANHLNSSARLTR